MENIIRFFEADTNALLWTLATVGLVVVEVASAQLVCIWFAFGSLGAVLAAVFGFGFPIQLLVFAVVSGITLFFTRPFAMRVLAVKKTPTNADSVIGLCGAVIQDIDNETGSGRVRISGQDWAARTADNSVMHTGEMVVVQSISGVKLIVLRKE